MPDNERPERPRCPDHPTSGVADPRRFGTEKRVWMCLACARELGPAPAWEPTWESFVISPGDVKE